jgi:hypothetical protein
MVVLVLLKIYPSPTHSSSTYLSSANTKASPKRIFYSVKEQQFLSQYPNKCSIQEGKIVDYRD